MANLIELFDNIVQMQNLNGVPLANGKLYVYALGRTRLMDTWSDVDGESLNTNPIILDDAGQAHCFVSDDFDYTLVVCDAYDNEIFSIDKYLYSKGEHSHADVAVAPSEHIGVSSYHVGETTVYVPYIQGELGKTYHGIEPIVVNNQENKISARNIPLGVQSPLYFAEDSESACIIAMSGEYQPVTGMSGYATTGDLVDLATSVSETYQPKGDYATHNDLSGFMEESKLETADGKITAYAGTAFAGGSVVPSEFIPWSASGNFATSGDLNDKLDTTAFSTVSGDFITAIPDTYASKDFVSSSVSSKLDSTAFSTVSGDFITALPEGLLNESGFEYDGDKISAYNGSAFVGQGGGGITGEYELSAGNGISIDNYPIEQKTVISVTGNYATEDWVTGQGYLTAETDWTDTITAASANAYNEATAAIPAPFDPSYLSGQIDTKLDSAIYAEDSGKFLTAHQSLADYQTTAGMTAYQPVGDYLTTGDSANFYPSDNPSAFITGVDLTPYQTVEGMTAYQSAGEYYSASNPSGFLVADDITGKLDASIYAADSGNFLTAVPDTYLQNTDLTITDGKVTEISGVPLSAGDELPSGVMNTSALEYNAVNEISGYNGSAIAQYGAEKQWLVHDDTLVHASNSAQYALGCNISAIAQLLGVDETLLFSGDDTQVTASNSVDLNDNWRNYNRIKINYMHSFGPSDTTHGGNNHEEISVLTNDEGFTLGVPGVYTDAGTIFFDRNSFGFTTAQPNKMYINAFGSRLGFTSAGGWTTTNARGVKNIKVIGIGRKQ